MRFPDRTAFCIVFILLTIIYTCTAVGAAAEEEPYRLDAGDVIKVTVWGHNELAAQVILDPDGRVSLPLLGEVEARGLTLAELTGVLAQALAAYIRDPQVSVALVEERRIAVKVFGQVNRPGEYHVRADASIAELIAMAGGPTDRAALERVELLQGGDPQAVEVVPQGRNDRFGADGAIRGPRLTDGDLIFVPETNRIDWEFVLAILGGLLTLKQLVS